MLCTKKISDNLTYAIEHNKDIISEQGSSRSGKTYNTLLWLIGYIQNNFDKKYRISIVRATLPALKGSVFVDFKDILVKLNIWKDSAMNKTDFYYTFKNGTIVEFFSCDSEQKLRGRKRDILYCNEANELTFDAWQQLKLRTTRFAIIDYNPSFTDEHWICGVNKQENCHHFITTYKDNIDFETNKSNLEQTIIDEIESLQWKNPALWQIYGEGKQAIVEGLVFPYYETIEGIPTQVDRRYIGVDYGYTNDPTAIIEVATEGDNLYLNELCYKTHLSTGEIVHELKQHNLRVISESADPRMIDELYRAGINIQAVNKYKGSIEAGILRMQSLKIHITKQSTNLIKEFKNYTYQRDKEGKWLNAPIDAFNHGIDAVRYVVLETIMTKQSGVRRAMIF